MRERSAIAEPAREVGSVARSPANFRRPIGSGAESSSRPSSSIQRQSSRPGVIGFPGGPSSRESADLAPVDHRGVMAISTPAVRDSTCPARIATFQRVNPFEPRGAVSSTLLCGLSNNPRAPHLRVVSAARAASSACSMLSLSLRFPGASLTSNVMVRLGSPYSRNGFSDSERVRKRRRPVVTPRALS
jgi:hypothetical protein